MLDDEHEHRVVVVAAFVLSLHCPSWRSRGKGEMEFSF